MISDILSRLISINISLSQKKDYTKLDTLHTYTYITTLIKISNNFKARIVKGY